MIVAVSNSKFVSLSGNFSGVSSLSFLDLAFLILRVLVCG